MAAAHGSGGEETKKQLAGDRNRGAKKLEDVVGSRRALVVASWLLDAA
jgi:hypothetical protein